MTATTTTTRRIVKFRVINPKTGKIVGYEQLKLLKEGGQWQFSLDDKEWEPGIFEGDDWLRDQATGVYNQIQREFYENDIVARAHHTNVVLFSHGRFGMKERGQKWAFPDGTTIFPLDKKLQIIGTLHANPELLEGNA